MSPHNSSQQRSLDQVTGEFSTYVLQLPLDLVWTITTEARREDPAEGLPPGGSEQQRERRLWKCLCQTAAGRPLSARDYKFIFCKGTFWHNVRRKDIKSNLSANETRKQMWRRERQHILLKYVGTPLRSQRVPLSDTQGWNAPISADNIYTKEASTISLNVSKTPVVLSIIRGLAAQHPWDLTALTCSREQPITVETELTQPELNNTFPQKESRCPRTTARARSQHQPHCSPKHSRNAALQQGVGRFCLQ